MYPLINGNDDKRKNATIKPKLFNITTKDYISTERLNYKKKKELNNKKRMELLIFRTTNKQRYICI